MRLTSFPSAGRAVAIRQPAFRGRLRHERSSYMPGIVGLITKVPRERAEPQLQRMLGAIRHDSSYTTGTWIDESLGVYVGWALRAGSFCDGMPLINERRDVVLVFSGEEYPDPGIVASLRRQGHALDSKPGIIPRARLRGRPHVPSRLERQVSGTLDRPASGKGDALQRPLRDASCLLPRVERRVLLCRRGQGDPGGASRPLPDRSPRAGRVSHVRLCPREQDTVYSHQRAAARLGLGLSEWCRRAEKDVFPSE